MKLSIIVPSRTGQIPATVNEFREKGHCVDMDGNHISIEVISVAGISPPGRLRKQGFFRSTGDYIWFVDDDDEIVCEQMGNALSHIHNADIYRFSNADGFDMNIGNKIYRRAILGQVFANVDISRMWRFEDGVMYAAALKLAKTIIDVPVQIYNYLQRPDSVSTMFDGCIVAEAEAMLAFRPELKDRLATYVTTQLMRVKAPWHSILAVARQLASSPLSRGFRGRYGLAARNPILIWLYRIVKGL